METYSACAAMAGTAPDEWNDIVGVLDNFYIVAERWLKPGGNRGDIAQEIDQAFASRGWKETRIDIHTRGLYRDKQHKILDETDTVVQEGYLVDNRKGSVVVDVEWNAKDGNLDRDMAAYRAWHEAGLIAGAVLITKHRTSLKKLANELWNAYQKTLTPESRSTKLPIDLSTSTTTTFEKAELRIKRGTAGTCPLLVVGVCEATWNGQPYSER